MNILYVYAHPQENSLNASIMHHGVDSLRKLGAEVKLSDLYAMHFKAIADAADFGIRKEAQPDQYFFAQEMALEKNRLAPDIKKEMDKLAWADHIVFQFPLWWFSVPAIMKGWFDRVLVKGFSYDAGKVFEKGLLKGKTASFTVTTQSPDSAYTEKGVQGATLNQLLLHITQTLRFVGVEVIDPFVYYAAFNLTSGQEAFLMRDYDAYLEKIVNKQKAT